MLPQKNWTRTPPLNSVAKEVGQAAEKGRPGVSAAKAPEDLHALAGVGHQLKVSKIEIPNSS